MSLVDFFTVRFRAAKLSAQTMKARIIRYAEVEERFRDLVIELSRDSLDSTSIIEEGKAVAFALGVCIMQMKVPSSDTYPGKANVA